MKLQGFNIDQLIALAKEKNAETVARKFALSIAGQAKDLYNNCNVESREGYRYDQALFHLTNPDAFEAAYLTHSVVSDGNWILDSEYLCKQFEIMLLGVK